MAEEIFVPNPQWHILATSGVLVFSLKKDMPGKKIIICLLVFFLGALVDIDHLPAKELWNFCAEPGRWSISGLNLLYANGSMSAREHVNYFHTWEMLLIVWALSTRLENRLPLASFLCHMLMDATNPGNWVARISPLPCDICHFFAQAAWAAGYLWQLVN